MWHIFRTALGWSHCGPYEDKRRSLQDKGNIVEKDTWLTFSVLAKMFYPVLQEFIQFSYSSSTEMINRTCTGWCSIMRKVSVSSIASPTFLSIALPVLVGRSTGTLRGHYAYYAALHNQEIHECERAVYDQRHKISQNRWFWFTVAPCCWASWIAASTRTLSPSLRRATHFIPAIRSLRRVTTLSTMLSCTHSTQWTWGEGEREAG